MHLRSRQVCVQCPDSKHPPSVSYSHHNLSGTGFSHSVSKSPQWKKLTNSQASKTKRKGIRERPERGHDQHRPSKSPTQLKKNFKGITAMLVVHPPMTNHKKKCTCMGSGIRQTEDSRRMKHQLDVTCYFISLLMCSTRFGH